MEVLSEVGSKTTLRYAVQLLTPSAITARIAGRQNIVRDDIKVGYIDKAISFVLEPLQPFQSVNPLSKLRDMSILNVKKTGQNDLDSTNLLQDMGGLFLDAKSSAILLKENDDKYMH